MRPIRLMQPCLGREGLAAVREVLVTGYVTDGPQSRRLGEEVAALAQRRFGVAVSSGTAALHLALLALGVGPGDEVIVPDYTHPATALAVRAVGAEPVLADIDPRTFNLDPERCAAAVGRRTRAIVAVSLFGHPLDMAPLLALKERHGLLLIEDAACSLGAEFSGARAGSQADVACFSFHPRKVITTGEGGALVTDDAEVAERVQAMKQFGARAAAQAGRLSFEGFGLNYKLSDVLAALGLVQLARLADIVGGRRARAARYDELLAGRQEVSPPYAAPKALHTYQSYCCLLAPGSERDWVLSQMRAAGIECQIGTYALHREPYFAGLARAGELDVSRDVFGRALTLPLHEKLTERDQRRVCRTLFGLITRGREKTRT